MTAGYFSTPDPAPVTILPPLPTPGPVRVTLSTLAGSGYRFEVEDRGRGLATLRGHEGTGLGHQLVTMMAGRLGGAERREEAQPGTRFIPDGAGD